jgi:alkyl sulfatase BDS1-like metallo-beta-lactamase superfamily hydrolase
MTTFISNLNKASFLTPILLNQTLLVEIRPHKETSHFIELSSSGAKNLTSPPAKIDITLEGDEQDIEEVLLNNVSLKQLIAFGKISIKGSYRNFLKIEAIIKLS